MYKRRIGVGGRNSPVSSAMQKFGIDAVEISVLCSPQNLTPEDNALARAILEIKYIRELNACEGKGLNNAPGGEILNLPVAYIRTEMTPVAVYSLDGELVDTYPTLSACSEKMNVGRGALVKALDNHDMCVGGKYMLVTFGKEPLPSVEPFDRNKLKSHKYEPCAKMRNGDIQPCQRIPGSKTDSTVRHSGWANLINNFEVEQVGKDGIVVARYPSIKDASIHTGIRYSAIWSCVFGKTYSAYGFVWRKAE